MTMRRLAVFSAGIALCAGSPAFPDTEAPSPIVKVCLNSAGEIVTAEIVESSTYPGVDEAALKVATASRFKPGTARKDGKPSCIKFRVKFVLKDGEIVPEGT